MGCCSSTDSKDCCSSGGTGGCCSEDSGAQTDGISRQAEHLAELLLQTPEYQEFVRLANEVNALPRVQELLLQIRRSSSAYAGYGDQNALQDLYQQLEALPAVQAYRAAERALAGLLQAVDEAISTTACVEFAVNAVRSGCG